MSPTRVASTQAEEHWKVLAVRARSFRWAAAFLSQHQRKRVAALYAFCRAIDDLADSTEVRPEAREDLGRILTALQHEPHAAEMWPAQFQWFRSLCIECGIDFNVVRELLMGITSDLGEVRVQDDRELLRYCYRVAGTVGLMMCDVLNVREAEARQRAIDLGIAMQLTNICRDVLEDSVASRVYLPAARLAEHNVVPQDLVEGKANPGGVSTVVHELLVLAEGYYQSADVGMRFLPTRARWAILIASRLYRAIGHRLHRLYHCNALVGRVVVPWFDKLALVGSATARWLRLMVWPARPPQARPLRRHLEGLPYSGVYGTDGL